MALNMSLNMILNMVSSMVLNMVSNMALNMILNMIFNMVLNMVLKMVSNMIFNVVLNMNASQNTNLISTKLFISFTFYITSFLRHILDLSLRYSLIRVIVLNSNKINAYSSYEMDSSDNTFEMRPRIVLSDETANIAIFSCFF